jgi:transketolase
VGMALAEKVLAAQFNRSGFDIVDHHTYVFLGDGCLMEGISHEACSLAGTLRLGKLIAFYDDNGISIDGHVRDWFTDDTPKRFDAYGWHVLPGVDGHDAEAVREAIVAARAATDRPSLICCKTVIGYGAPNLCGSHDAHGAPLGEDEVAAARENLGWPHPPFVVPGEIYEAWNAVQKGAALEGHWNERFARYRESYPDLAAEFDRRTRGELPEGWEAKARAYVRAASEKTDAVATRKASQNTLNAFGPLLPEFIGGSADLTGSNNTDWKGSRPITGSDPDGNYLHFGVREFAMSALMNGIGLHGGFIPYGGTFLVFSDYARNAVRLAALMGVGSIFVYSHDSVGLGEDGPTHQPIEHLASLRYIPQMRVWRPCDAVETAVAWKAAVERRNGPSSLVLTRQNLPHQKRDESALDHIERGGYVLRDSVGEPEILLIASGSEVALAVGAAEQLTLQGRRARVVSMPCCEVFDAQDEAYREAVLPSAVKARVAVEAGVSHYWRKYVGPAGRIVGIDRFGESAPGGAVFKHLGFTVDNVVQAVHEAIGH